MKTSSVSLAGLGECVGSVAGPGVALREPTAGRIERQLQQRSHRFDVTVAESHSRCLPDSVESQGHDIFWARLLSTATITPMKALTSRFLAGGKSDYS